MCDKGKFATAYAVVVSLLLIGLATYYYIVAVSLQDDAVTSIDFMSQIVDDWTV